MRIDHYLNQYNHKKSLIEKQERKKKSMLRTTEYHSIFAEQEINRRGQEREKKQNRSIQEQLYQNYVENPQIYRPAEKDYEVTEGPQTVLEMGGKNNMKQMYLLDLEIDRLKKEEQI